MSDQHQVSNQGAIIETLAPELKLLFEMAQAEVHADPFANESKQLFQELMGESDRGAALIGVAFIEDLLARLICRRVVDAKIAKRLLGDGGNGPLSNISARIELAY